MAENAHRRAETMRFKIQKLGAADLGRIKVGLDECFGARIESVVLGQGSNELGAS